MQLEYQVAIPSGRYGHGVAKQSLPSKRFGLRQADSSNRCRKADVWFADRFGQRRLTVETAPAYRRSVLRS